jgi:dTDP-4-dehydrorhamnose reductase
VKTLTTGSQGMLGQDLAARLQPRHEVIPFTRADADITDANAITKAIRHASREAVIHAAFAAVDRCESERELALRVNGEGRRDVAVACQELKIPLLYVSTDCVLAERRENPISKLTPPIL